MATNHYRVKNNAKSNRQNFMESNLQCAQEGASESVMKIMTQQIDSAPPKPARRRYSEQISAISLGTLSSNKKVVEEHSLLKNESLPKVSSNKPAYLSLPANLTSSPLTEFNNAPLSPLHSCSLSDQLKYSKDEPYFKNSLDKFKWVENSAKQMCTSVNNKYDSKEKLQFISQGTNANNVFSNYQYGNSASYLVDKLTRNSSVCGNRIFTGYGCDCQNLKLSHKSCHRRHHSDPTISNFNLSNQSISLKCDTQRYFDNLSYSTKKFKCCDSTSSCCKKNYFFMQEIHILKEINEKLWQHLCSVQSSLENMKKKAHEEYTDISISGLLSSVYYAQRAKDCAMEERLKIAFEERDAALLELEDMIHVMTKSFDSTDEVQCAEKELDEGIKELLHEIGCSHNPSRLLKYQRMLLAQICNFKESKQDCLSHELKRTIIERDNALEKVAKLEEEIKGLKMCYDLWHLDNKHWETTLFDVLHQLLQQRENILSKVDSDLDIGNILCRSSLGGRLESLERHTVSQYEALPRSTESNKGHQSLIYNDCKLQHSFSTSDEIYKLKEEVSYLNRTLENEMKKREQTEGKCLRLERLVHILRKKLNGQNIGVPV